ncbi:MAG: hypothetical protein V4686_01805 [Patescibacteria group bacterium]
MFFKILKYILITIAIVIAVAFVAATITHKELKKISSSSDLVAQEVTKNLIRENKGVGFLTILTTLGLAKDSTEAKQSVAHLNDTTKPILDRYNIDKVTLYAEKKVNPRRLAQDTHQIIMYCGEFTVTDTPNEVYPLSFIVEENKGNKYKWRLGDIHPGFIYLDECQPLFIEKNPKYKDIY